MSGEWQFCDYNFGGSDYPTEAAGFESRAWRTTMTASTGEKPGGLNPPSSNRTIQRKPTMSMTTLSDLENLNVDVEVAPPDQYVDSGNSLIPEAMYDLAVNTWEASTNRDSGQPDGKAVILTLRVVGGDCDGRTARNIRVWTTTYERNGAKASQLGDLIRAIDDQATWTTYKDACEIIQRAQDQGQTFRAKLKWEAFDVDWYRDQGGDAMVPKSQEQKALRKAASIAGMSNFRQAPDGTFLPEVNGPGGNTLEARLSLDRFVPSGKRR